MIPLDIETTGLNFNTGRILGTGIGSTFHKKPIAPIGPVTCQNGRFEVKWLKKAGIEIDWAFDSLLAASILLDRPADLDLGTLASYYLGQKDWKADTDKLFKKKDWVQKLEADPALFRTLAKRNLADLRATKKLTTVLDRKLREEGMSEFFYEKLMPAARMMAETEYIGMGLDVEATKKELVQVEEQILQLEKELLKWAGCEINFNSPKQLLELLKSKGYKMWIWDFKSRGLKESTGVDALENLLPNENISKLLEYRGAQKLKGYLKSWLEEQFEGQIHASFNLASTRTGRLSSSTPNLQQVPRESAARKLFIPPKGMKFVIGDFAQIEPRLAAHFSKDEALLTVFKNQEDFYGSIAVRVLGVECAPNDVKKLYPDMRRVSKEIGLSILYGIGAGKLISLIKKKAGVVFTEHQGKQIIRDYFRAYPGLLEFRQYVIGKIERGETLHTPFGRQFRIDPSKAFSTGINTVCQSTASDACLFPQLEVDKELKKLDIYAPLILLCHDEAVRWAKPEEAQKVGEVMEKIMINQPFDCPLKFEWAIGNSWGDKV